jgi:4-carboxymuconolactone decarboxylase
VERSTAHLVRLSALAVRPALRDELRDELAAARESGTLRREEIDEAFLQLHLFAGFPAALEAMRALEKLWPRTTAQSPSEPADPSTHAERGQELYDCVYAKNARIVERELVRLSPELAQWALVDGYGKTLARAGLDLRTRELCIVAVLTQLGWDRQLFSHILGARNVGASHEDILEAITIGALGEQAKEERGRELLDRA